DLFDKPYDYLSQCEPHVNASRAKRNARNHEPLALVANSYTRPLYSHASPSYSRSPQPYYVTHPTSMHNYDDHYKGEIQGRITGNQATNAGNGFAQKNVELNENFQRIPRTTSTLRKTNVQCYNYNEKIHYARDSPKPKVYDSKYFRKHILLAAKDEVGVNLDKEENEFMLMNAYGDGQLEELNVSVIMMACI
nr:hypothetical protein [Tanacetum cinerariifolium]GEX41797.1 hypothetical protein [Tanacetum cinerariifolium]